MELLYHYFQENPTYLVLAVFTLSLMIGSFLNVFILRYPVIFFRNKEAEYLELKKKQPNHYAIQDLSKPFSLSYPKSHCPKCLHEVKPWQNIPVISYFILKGACGECSSKIPLRYPAIEAATAIVSASLLFFHGWSIELALMLFLTWSLLAIAVISFDYNIVPKALLYPLIWVGVYANSFDVFVSINSSLMGVLAGVAVVYVIHLFSTVVKKRKAMSSNEYNLLLVIGAWFGWEALLPTVLIVAAFVSFLSLVKLITNGTIQPNASHGAILSLSGWIVSVLSLRIPFVL